MGKQDLQSFINIKKQHAAEEVQIDWEGRKNEWLRHLNALYKDIEKWLSDFENHDMISFEYRDIELNEEYIGLYSVRKMEIKIADELILLTPVGTLLIGAQGRVDVKGKNGTMKFVLVPEQSDSPAIKMPVVVEGETKKAETPEDGKKLAWKIATPPPTMKYIDLNVDSFSDALLAVAGG